MKLYEYKQFSRGNLPHIHPPGATLFVTFRLHGSVPQPVLRSWKAQKLWLDEESARLKRTALKNDSPEVLKHSEDLAAFKRRWFRKFEDILHEEKHGPLWLKNEPIAKIVTDSLHWRDGKVYRLIAYCVMSNHVHVVFRPFLTEESLQVRPNAERLTFESVDPPLDRIMQSLKGYTAHESNRVLGREGQFWARESYDHVVRNAEEHERIIKYVLNNPVKAGLVSDWREWRWSWKRSADPSYSRLSA